METQTIKTESIRCCQSIAWVNGQKIISEFELIAEIESVVNSRRSDENKNRLYGEIGRIVSFEIIWQTQDEYENKITKKYAAMLREAIESKKKCWILHDIYGKRLSPKFIEDNDVDNFYDNFNKADTHYYSPTIPTIVTYSVENL